MANVAISQNFFERHRAKIAFAGQDQCWLWTAGKFKGGYGRTGKTRLSNSRLAHRAAYVAVHGEGSADGLVVRHRCDVRACVNPGHLDVGTIADNNRDTRDRGRLVSYRGSRNGNSKLTEDDVRTIRATCSPGDPDFGLRPLSRLYGVSYQLIGKIVHREVWPHVL